MLIPFLDLKKINEPYFISIHEATKKVVSSGWFILGNEVASFEKEFAAYCGAKHCIAVGNGLDALVLILKASDFPENSEIIVPSNTYIASILAVSLAGFKPVLVEPKLENYLIDTQNIEKSITKHTKAILLVNLYGKMCDIDSVRELAVRYNLRLYDDSAQSHGSYFKNKICGSTSDASAFSFYPTKNLGALGDGGAITTDDDILAEKLRKLRNYGSGKKYVFDYQGMNSRLDEIQAAILREKLKNLDAENAYRRKIANRYLNEIKNPLLTLPPSDSVNQDAWHLFVVRVSEREKFRNYLSACGISTDVHYPIPPHKQLAYQEWNQRSFPISEKIHNEIVSIPLNVSLHEDEVTYIIQKINDYQAL
jgi:dTDP-4-amino-4,6-dideoxygalactose transaminase